MYQTSVTSRDKFRVFMHGSFHACIFHFSLIIKWRFVGRVKQQMMSLMEGFNELIPQNMLQIFDENEVELLLCGLQDIDVNDWKNNTVYKGEYNPNHPVIINFWRVSLHTHRPHL
jgi:hypothetical protein